MPDSRGEAVHLSVVVPAFNEAGRIAETLRRIEAFCSKKGRPWQVIVVSDGSRDATAAEAESFFRSHPRVDGRLISFETNHGKGYAVRQGVLACAGEHILVTDADLSAPIKESDKLVRALEEGADVAIGSRSVRSPGCDVRQSFRRKLSGRIFNLVVRLVILRGIGDTQCGFKCFKREAAMTLFREQKLDGFSFDVEVLRLARNRGMAIREVSVMWKEGSDSRVSLFRDAFRMVRDLFRIRKSIKKAGAR